MIATALTFVFGFCAALLLALLLAPLVWRRAQRLALREFEAAIPANVNEIRASIDHVRAEAALTTRRREIKAEEDMRKAALERAEAGRVAGENAELRARNTTLSETVAQQTADLKEIAETLEAREREIDEFDEQLRHTRHDLELRTEEMDALAERFRELGAIAEERKLNIISAETKIEQLSDELRQTERQSREGQNLIERLKSETSALEAHLQKEKAATRRLDEKVTRLTSQLADRDEQLARLLGAQASTAATAATARHARSKDRQPPRRVADKQQPQSEKAPEDVPMPKPNGRPSLAETLDLPERPILDEDVDEEGLRQKVSDLAARVIAMTATAEGPRSPLDTILSADQDSPRRSDAPSLAERVRRIQNRQTVKDHAAE
ncbi:hypothetical protein [Aurantimonas sp. VKM B-3413]|uniref:hypothetical protein n=1 Tax=Aurantimonas sp. VKM B-3413 TaxID=2779401 RepID=UPI001E3DAEA3|nr:hypothetical protein [Aurantimonas sp. VKM B-3413]MCB8839011.1 hypothetical protein [Aurantimonas sp. VKM B-3413]